MAVRILLFVTLFATVQAAAPEYPQLGPNVYDTKADGTAQIATALERARAEHKNVLVMFGANWCIWCHRLHATLATNPEISRVMAQNFELVMIDVNTRHGTARNAAVDARYGHPIELGLPVLVVLNESGQKLATQDSGLLEDGKSAHDPHKVLAFLDKWKPRG